MNLNTVVLSGKLAAAPELRTLESGVNLLRYLVTLRSTEPVNRIDVVPVSYWDPPEHLLTQAPPPGHPIHVAGSVQRRFWSEAEGRRSCIEVVAREVCLTPEPDIAPFCGPGEMGAS